VKRLQQSTGHTCSRTGWLARSEQVWNLEDATFNNTLVGQQSARWSWAAPPMCALTLCTWV